MCYKCSIPSDFPEWKSGDVVVSERDATTGDVHAGQAYTVCSTSAGEYEKCEHCGDEELAFTLRDAPNHGAGWCPCGFRRVYKPDPKLLKDLMEPVPGLEIDEKMDVFVVGLQLSGEFR